MSKALITLVNNAISTRQLAVSHEEQGIRQLKAVCNDLSEEITKRLRPRPGAQTVKVEPTSIYPEFPVEEIAIRVTITRVVSNGMYYETSLATIRHIDKLFNDHGLVNWSTDNVDGRTVTEIVYR